MNRATTAVPLLLVCGCIFGDNPAFVASAEASGSTSGVDSTSSSSATSSPSSGSTLDPSATASESTRATSGETTSAPETDSGSACPEVDLQTDADNCGACGVRCFESACEAGTCAVYVVADGQDDPYGIAVDDGHVYWTNRGSTEIMRADKVGGPPEVLAVASDAFDSPTEFVDLTPDFVLASLPNAGSAEVRTGSPLVAVPKGGGPPGPLGYAVADGVASIHAAGPFVYLAHRTQNAVRRAFLAGDLTETVTDAAPGVRDVTLLEGMLYFCGSQGVARVSTEGGTVEPLAVGEVVEGMTIVTDGERIYVTTVTGMAAIDPQTQDVSLFADAQVGTMGLGVDDTHAYWVARGAGAEGGVLYAADKADPSSTEARVTGLPVAHLLAHDESQVFWTNRGARPGTGLVLRAAK